jgi:hypothetical protein
MRRALWILTFVLACKGHGRDPNASPWSTVAIGTTYVSRTMTRMQKPFEHDTETVTKQTLVSRNGKTASVRLELGEGSASTTQDLQLPLHEIKVPPHDGSTVSTASEVCTVPAGTFRCTRTTVEIHQGDVTRSTVTWTDPTIAVPLRTIVTTENMTVTTDLTSITPPVR